MASKKKKGNNNKVETLHSQIQTLASKVGNMQLVRRPTSNPNRSRQRRRNPMEPRLGGPVPFPTGNMAEGSMTVSGHEYFIPVQAEELSADTVKGQSVCPGKSQIPLLDSMGKIWDRYQILQMEIEFHPSVGTTTDGTITIGVDYDPRLKPNTFGKVMSLNPLVVGPVWQSQKFIIPRNRLGDRKYTYRSAESTRPDELQTPFLICYATDARATPDGATPPKPIPKALGRILVRYRVRFDGPNLEN